MPTPSNAGWNEFSEHLCSPLSTVLLKARFIMSNVFLSTTNLIILLKNELVWPPICFPEA